MSISRKFSRESDPIILIDVNEVRKKNPCKLASALIESPYFKTIVKDADACRAYLGLEQYEPWGDYIVLFPPGNPVHPDGAMIGIERKTTVDAFGRILDGTMNEQLSELIGKTHGKAILLHEKSDYVPANIVRGIHKNKTKGRVSKAEQASALRRIRTAVSTKFNKLDFAVVRWEIENIDQCLRHFADLCEFGWNYEIEGRGYRVHRNGLRIGIKKIPAKPKV